MKTEYNINRVFIYITDDIFIFLLLYIVCRCPQMPSEQHQEFLNIFMMKVN